MDDPSEAWSRRAGPPGPGGPEPPSRLATGPAVLLTAVAVVLGVILLAYGSRPPVKPSSAPTAASSPPTTTTTTTVAPTTTTTTVPRSTVRVQVANGTSAPNAAAHFTLLLQTQGWNTQAPLDTTAPAPNSAVYYGPNQKASALTIASELKIPPSAVSPTTAAVPVRNASSVDVVVVIGTALAGKGFPAVTPASTASTAAS